MYWKNKPILKTWYKNNGDYTAKYDGIKLTEKMILSSKSIINTCIV
jgi:hypothetical protein